MKIITSALIGMMVCAGNASAAQFKLLNPLHPQVVTGVYDNLKGGSDAGSALSLVTYKGPITWSPVNIGGTLGQGLGGPSIALGSFVNLLPEVKAGSLLIVNAVFSDPVKFANLKKILSPTSPGLPDLTMSFGPNASYVFYDGLKGKIMFTMFYGASLKF